MGEQDDAVTLAVVAARLSDLKTQVGEIGTMLTAQRAEFVGRNEWLMRNATVDTRFEGQGREIADLKTELRTRRLPWPTVAAVVVAGAALALEVVSRIS